MESAEASGLRFAVRATALTVRRYSCGKTDECNEEAVTAWRNVQHHYSNATSRRNWDGLKALYIPTRRIVAGHNWLKEYT